MPRVAVQFDRVDNLPRLAWCAVEEKGRVLVRHGPWVEVGEGFFVEGAWDGPFEAGEFYRSPVFMGSGGRMRGSELQLCTSCTPLEYLFRIRQSERTVTSNSLAFALVETGLSLDRAYPDYRRDLWSCNLGLRRRRRTIPTSEGPLVDLLLYCNGDEAKPQPPDWKRFEEYEAQLLVWLKALIANAQSEHRTIRYRGLASISSGYDSAAATALAANAGLEEAFSFATGIDYPAIRKRVDDSGAAIAERLGVRVELVAPDGAVDCEHEAEFASCGDGFDYQLGRVADALQQKLFITGFRGDHFWDRNPATVGSDLVGLEPIGTSLGELRLSTGFVHAPVPALGGVRHPTLHQISNSEAMSLWSVGGSYDRPIPRRILESRDIPRGTFAAEKCGSWKALQFGPRGASRSRQFEEFYARHRPRVLSLSGQYLRYLSSLVTAPTYFQRRLPGRHTLSVQWGTEVMQRRYQEALGRS